MSVVVCETTTLLRRVRCPVFGDAMFDHFQEGVIREGQQLLFASALFVTLAALPRAPLEAMFSVRCMGAPRPIG